MSELKTKATNASVEDFLNAIEHPTRKADGLKLLEIFKEETGMDAVLWGPSIIGFGSYDYKYPNGKTMTWFPVGYSPRKASISLYLMRSHEEMKDELDNFGKHKRGKGCIYVNKLVDIDESVLRKMIRETYQKLVG
ncbi:DUF1801 domain-containing protein [Algoriphagus sediminis]|uniref:DUF1801 domain-containing protein n=1 Tax=Algoriphagus sediminis TaxID=3057113 RepID=A0ABT7YAK3_9BACT|nr:DUF1801 domain-containing protein [Algoriphagus sediminis]MDN3203234.1 DUF1801 domain-containing protein [Algoriphagus sediminis]